MRWIYGLLGTGLLAVGVGGGCSSDERSSAGGTAGTGLLEAGSGGSQGGEAGGEPSAGTGGATGGASGSGAGQSGASGETFGSTEPESPSVNVSLVDPRASEKGAIDAKLAEVAELTPAELFSRYPTHFGALGYDPLTALGLDTLDASALSLEDDAKDILSNDGFVISDRQSFPSFVAGYTAIYGEHLPLYVSADSILDATHRSYDNILEQIELIALSPRLEAMLTSMRSALAAGAADPFGAGAVADADVYVSVAASLLADEVMAPAAGGPAAEVSELYEAARAAEGLRKRVFLGVPRAIDFSQYAPRGHYLNDPTLERYFRATMWLGSMDLRLIETLDTGKQVFRRRQLELAYALRALFDDTALADYEAIDGVVRAFVGESDNMTLPELDGLLSDLGVAAPEALSTIDDETLAQAILDGGYGLQRISGGILENGTQGPIPLSSTFLLLGRRYVVDSEVFSNVVYGRVPVRDGAMRLMPNPLDVAFAALENDQAATLLAPELDNYHYAPELAATRLLVDFHEPTFWSANLYNGWLSALRALSPPSDLADAAALGLPRVAGTEAWGRRILSAQLASWAELRHDTLLYAKQSYTDAPECEFPDGYVDPYPEFYATLGNYARRGRAVVENLGDLAGDYLGAAMVNYFDELETTSGTLQALAEKQRTGEPFGTDEIAFLNRAIGDSENCFFDPDGWYPRLVYLGVASETDTEYDPTIADVHTQPADEGGAIVGNVLHVGTGPARLMVVTADTCVGPRAYVGLASSYFERITTNFERLTDQQWASEVQDARPPDVPWVVDLVAR